MLYSAVEDYIFPRASKQFGNERVNRLSALTLKVGGVLRSRNRHDDGGHIGQHHPEEESTYFSTKDYLLYVHRQLCHVTPQKVGNIMQIMSDIHEPGSE